MLDLEAIERIKQLKSRYFRLMDTANFAELKTVFTDDAGIHYRGPNHDNKRQGWADIEAFFRETFTDKQFGFHTGHHPEITVDGDTATGIWYLHDKFISLKYNVTIEGTALYHDQYVKEDGEWKIAFSEYDRLFEEITQRNDAMTITSIPVKL